MNSKLFLAALVAVIPIDGVIGPKADAHQDMILAHRYLEKLMIGAIKDVAESMDKEYEKALINAVEAMGDHAIAKFTSHCRNMERHQTGLDSLACVFIKHLGIHAQTGGAEGTPWTHEESAKFNKVREIVETLKGTMMRDLTLPIEPVPWNFLQDACNKLEKNDVVDFICTVVEQEAATAENNEAETSEAAAQVVPRH